jgi:hypothetical protein
MSNICLDNSPRELRRYGRYARHCCLDVSSGEGGREEGGREGGRRAGREGGQGEREGGRESQPHSLSFSLPLARLPRSLSRSLARPRARALSLPDRCGECGRMLVKHDASSFLFISIYMYIDAASVVACS